MRKTAGKAALLPAAQESVRSRSSTPGVPFLRLGGWIQAQNRSPNSAPSYIWQYTHALSAT